MTGQTKNEKKLKVTSKFVPNGKFSSNRKISALVYTPMPLKKAAEAKCGP